MTTSSILKALLAAGVLVAASPNSAQTAAAGPQTLGFVITDIRYALYETDSAKEECPDGLQVSELEQFKATPGHLERLKLGGTFHNRGPGGALANYSPEAITDIFPFRELKTEVGFGFNLRGSQAGPNDSDFISPSGERVQNQMARVVGCVEGWRTRGAIAERFSKEVETSPYNRILINITDIDNIDNDDKVDIFLYKGMDRIVRTASGDFVPYISQRVDRRLPEFISRGTGKIVNGDLVSDPFSFVSMPAMIAQIIAKRNINQFHLRMKITDDNVSGHFGGYEYVEYWWNTMSKSVYSDIGKFSPTQLYEAVHKYADGDCDAVGRQCRSISSTYKFDAVRAIIIDK